MHLRPLTAPDERPAIRLRRAAETLERGADQWAFSGVKNFRVSHQIFYDMSEGVFRY
jgi:hypothetical protein